MPRIRKLFALLAALVALPLALLVQRAVASVERERDAYHAAVAARVFDEMERALSELLHREEERPFGHYQYEYVPDDAGASPAARVRSPLARIPAEPWVLGYFELDADGSFRTPLRSGAAGWRPEPAVAARIADLAAWVRRGWPAGAEGERAGRRPPPPTAAGAPDAALHKDAARGTDDLGVDDAALAPGSTVALEQQRQGLDKLAWQASERLDVKESLSSLNRGAEGRSRATKVAQTAAPNIAAYAAQAQAPPAAAIAPPTAGAASPAAAADTTDERRQPRDADGARPQRRAAAPPAGRTPVDVSLEPMVARLVDPARLLLYRAVWIDGRAIRQGLVLDVGELARWLVDGTVGQGELAEHVAVDLSSAPAPPAQDGYVYHHRFAEPFGDLSAVLAVAPLPDAVRPTYVYALALALLLAFAGGLLALYRMVGSVVDFAQRRNDFVAAVTHELKTPLTSIRMYGEMLQEDMVANDAKRREYYRSITSETERLSRLIDNVLELSRLEKGTRQTRLVAGSLAEVLREAVTFFAPQAEREGFTLVLDLPARLTPVLYDKDAVVQVLFNLIDNALKYARGARERRIVISGRDAGDRVVLTVRDHGPGVPDAHLRRIFEPFYRAQDELTRSAKGAGIGLALVRGLVETMDGEVTGRNAAGGGFEVEVALKAAG